MTTQNNGGRDTQYSTEDELAELTPYFTELEPRHGFRVYIGQPAAAAGHNEELRAAGLNGLPSILTTEAYIALVPGHGPVVSLDLDELDERLRRWRR
jgi:hypothetical protein